MKHAECPECGDWNTFVEEREEIQSSKASKQQRILSETLAKPKPYEMVDAGDAPRFPSGIGEFDRVLGGGVVPGSLVLIGGEPGIGKSTLLLQVAQLLARTGGAVLYVSGEESERQIKLRGDRLGVGHTNVHGDVGRGGEHDPVHDRSVERL